MPLTSSIEWWRPAAPEAQPRPTAVPRRRIHDASLPFWSLMTFTVVMVLAPQNYFPSLEPFRIALLISILAATTYVFSRIVHGRGLGFGSRELLLAGLLTFWAALTIPFSYDPAGSAYVLLNHFSKTLILFWLLSNVLSSPRRLHQAFWMMSLMAVVLAYSAIDNFLTGVYMAAHETQRIRGYEGALTGNPNDLALMLNLIIPMSVALLFTTRGGMTRFWLILTIALSAAAVVATFSRAGFLTLASLLLLYCWKLRHRPQKGWVFGIVLFMAICIPLIGPAYIDRLSTITNIESDKTGSAQERWEDMAAAARFTLAHPLIGAGIGQNVLATQEERGRSGGLVHNVYLEYASELALPGLALFLALFIFCLKSAALVQAHGKRTQDSAMFYIGEAIQLSLIAFGMSAMFYPVAYHVFFYYVAGLAVAAKSVVLAK